MSKPDAGIARRFVGAWRLVSETADGMLTYDPSGAMSVQSAPRRVRSRAGATPTPAEALHAIEGYVAYFGTYTIDEAAGVVTHHRVGNVQPGPADDLVRSFEFAAGDRLILRPVGGVGEIVWQRVG